MFTNNFKLDGIENILDDIGYLSEEAKDENAAGEDQEHKYPKKSGKKSKDYDKDGTVEDETDEYAGVKDKAIENAIEKEDEKKEKEGKEKEKEKKESVDFSSVLDELTDEDLLFLSDDLIEEVVEEFFYETLEEGFEIEELETLLIEQVESELTYLEEAKVTVGHDTDVKPEASRTSKLARVKDAVKKVASGAKAVAKKVAGAAGQVAGSAVAGYKKASAAAKDAPGGAEKDDSKSDTANTGSRTPRSSSGTKRPGILGRVGAALKSGLKKAIHGAGKVAGKVAKTAKAGYDEGRGKSAPAASTPAAKPAPKAAAKPASAPAAKPAAKKPAAKPVAKTATAKKKGGNLDNLLSQIRNEEVENIEEKAPPGAKYERMVKHIKAGYKKGGLTKKEKGIAYATAWKSYNEEKDPCWKGYEMIGMKKKGGREVPNCVPKEEYEELVMDMIQEGYDMDQVREVIAAYEDGFEVIFEEDGVVINDTQEVLDEVLDTPEKANEYAKKNVKSMLGAFAKGVANKDMSQLKTIQKRGEGAKMAQRKAERKAAEEQNEEFHLDEETQFLSDVEMVADWLHTEGVIENEDQFFELMEDLTEEEIEELYDVVLSEAERPIYGRGGKLRRTETPLEVLGKHATARDKKTKHNIPRGGRTFPAGKPNEGNPSSLMSGEYDRGKGNKAARRAGKTVADSRKEGYEMIGSSLEEGGLEVRTYSWREVMESQEARNNPEKYEAGQKKKYAPVRGEKTPMPPRGDKRREDFEKWYAANVR